MNEARALGGFDAIVELMQGFVGPAQKAKDACALKRQAADGPCRAVAGLCQRQKPRDFGGGELAVSHGHRRIAQNKASTELEVGSCTSPCSLDRATRQRQRGAVFVRIVQTARLRRHRFGMLGRRLLGGCGHVALKPGLQQDIFIAAVRSGRNRSWATGA